MNAVFDLHRMPYLTSWNMLLMRLALSLLLIAVWFSFKRLIR